MRHYSFRSRFIPSLLLIVCGVMSTAVPSYGRKKKQSKTVAPAASRRSVKSGSIRLSQGAQESQEQVIKGKLNLITTLSPEEQVARLPKLLEELQKLSPSQKFDSQLEQKIKEALRKVQGETTTASVAPTPIKEVPKETMPTTAPQTMEEIIPYVSAIIEKSHVKSPRVFEALSFPFRKADDFWLAHKEDPLERTQAVMKAHFLLRKILPEALAKSFFGKKEDAQEIMDGFNEKDQTRAEQRAVNETSYWLLFDLIHNQEQAIDTTVLQTIILPRAIKLSAYNFNVNKVVTEREKAQRICGTKIAEVVARENLHKFMAQSAEPGKTPDLPMLIMKHKAAFLKGLTAEQQAKVKEPLQEMTLVLQGAHRVFQQNGEIKKELVQTGFFGQQEQPQPEGTTAPPPPKKKTSLGTMIALGLLGVAVLGSGYSIYQQMHTGGKSAGAAVKGLPGEAKQKFGDAVEGLKGIFERGKAFVTRK